jgi:pimeloyl-ACP methyl ester carboxylesterase
MTSERSFAGLSDGGRLSFLVRGDLSSRTPILLNRPLGGSMDLWGTFADRLADEYPLIAFDPRGVGQSSDAPLLHSTRAMARDAVELLDALRVQRAHVFGLSLGGMVASWLAVDAPERVFRLVLASTLPSSRVVSRRIFGELLRLGSSALTPGIEAEVALVHGILSPEFCREHSERIAALDHSLKAFPTKRRNLLALALASARHNVGACLKQTRADTLLLFGSRDPIAGRSAQRELVADLPYATLQIIPNSGHDISLEQPEAAAARIVGFLDRTPHVGYARP